MRNTPTCVGKTISVPDPVLVDMKHPHVRGENSRAKRDKRKHIETPPRAWGKPSSKPINQKIIRNTPTCVGKTQQCCRTLDEKEKHPHVRGENCAIDM